MNDKLSLFAFVSPTSNFDNPKNIEIKDHSYKISQVYRRTIQQQKLVYV